MGFSLPGMVTPTFDVDELEKRIHDLNAHIDKAEANGEWLIITIHESVLDSATPAGLQVKNGDLDTSLAYLASRVRLGGIQALHQREACRAYGITN